MPSRRLPVPALDAWSLMADCLAAGLEEAARGWADEAVQRSGWARYELAGSSCEDHVYVTPLLPGQWVYYGETDERRNLLVNRHAAPMLRGYLSWPRLTALARERGAGLLRLDVLLAELVMHAITPPEDASELIP